MLNNVVALDNAVRTAACAALAAFVLALGMITTPAAARQSATPAQSGSARGSVSGAVVDEAGVGLQAATAVLFAASDSSLVIGAATDAEGRFRFENIRAGRYWLRVSFIGFSDHNSDVFALSSGQAFSVPRVTLKSDALALADIEVEGERALVEVQPDKTVLNVQGTANAAGSDAMELLKKAPGVVVDNNDNIILSGKNGVKIYVDGKPSPLSAADLAVQLRAMQASEIDAIEIVTNPGAKYDAEGNAGIINIRLRRDRSLGFTSTLDVGLQHGMRDAYNANTTFNFRNRGLNVFGSYAISGGDYLNWMDIYRIQNDVLYDQVSSNDRNGLSNTFRFGADLFLGQNLVAGVLVNGNSNKFTAQNSSRTPITDLGTNVTESVLEAATENDGLRQNINVNGNLRWDNHAGTTSNLDVDAGFFHNSTDSYQPNYFRNQLDPSASTENIFTSSAPTNIDIYAAKFDHERSFAGGTLGVGAKVSNVETDNRYGFFQLVDGLPERDVDRSNDFFFRETIGAGYANFAGTIGAAEYSLGLRGEYTNSQGDLTAFKESDNTSVTRGYFDIFPSGGISFKVNEQNQLRFNYSRRIDRPNYADLNPFEFKLDELTFAKGNPFIQPQYTNSVSVTHTYKYLLNTTLSYSYTDDYFAKISDTTDVSRTVLNTVNMHFQQVVSGSISYPYSPTEWWSTYTSLTGYNTRNRADLAGGRTVDISQTVGNIYHQSSFSMPAGVTLEVSGYYNTPSIWGAVYIVEANYSVDTGLRKQFMGGKANLKLTLSDVFNTSPWRAKQEFSGLFMDVRGGWDSRRLRVNFSYIFGNSQVKKARQRQTSTADETGRTG